MTSNDAPAALVTTLLRWLKSHFNLTDDKADDAVIDQGIRAGVTMRGTNLWVLIFAIFVASVGLNVNSTAVIIGAMLISPLMGPIMGIGYGVGVHDFTLIRTAFNNLLIAVTLSLLTSTLYFLVTPLTAVQSEILARTTPTIWDVLIALFGGLAGMVGTTRKEKSNVLPGVAIATALMPPLCTAGYAVANGNWKYFLGAFYLFTINSVFIAVASAVVIRVLHVREINFVNPATANRVRRYVFLVVLVTSLPSLFLAYNLVKTEVFKSRALQFVNREIASPRTHIVDAIIDSDSRTIDVTVIGDFIPKERLSQISGRLSEAGLGEAKLQLHQTDQAQHLDLSILKAGVLSDLYAESQHTLEARDRQIKELQDAVQLSQKKRAQLANVPAELSAFFPQIDEAWLADTLHWEASSGLSELPTTVLDIHATRQISNADQKRIEKWLAARIGTDHVKIVIETGRSTVRPFKSNR